MRSLIPSSLRRNRNMHKKSLSTVSGLAGMSPQHLSDVESGKVDARISTIERIAAVLGFTVMLVPRDKVSQVRRYLATDGRAYQKLHSGDHGHEHPDFRSE